MRKTLFTSITVFIFISTFSQTQTFDIATFTPPGGWQRVDSLGTVFFGDSKTNNGLTSFCYIYLYPSRPSNESPEKNFETEWNNRVAQRTGITTKPTTQTEKTSDGWTAVTGVSNITYQGITYSCLLTSLSGFNKVMTVLVNIAGPEYMAQVESFFNSLELNGHVQAQNSTVQDIPGNTTTTQAVTMSNYDFTPPARWYIQKGNDYITMTQTQTPGRGCIISIQSPTASSGNLETEAMKIFNQMYPGWQFRYTGSQHDDVTKGYTSQGLEFYRFQASMQKDRGNHYYYDYEKADVIVINLGSKVAVIASRHERGESVCFCDYQYEYFGIFFNSFTVKNASPAKNVEDITKKLVGSWQNTGSRASLKYIFAANKRYQFIGAYSTTSRIAWNLIEIKTSGFKGDGSYAYRDKKLIISKDGSGPEIFYVRMEKVNHGSSGWKDRMYMKSKGVEGTDIEVCYEKEEKPHN